MPGLPPNAIAARLHRKPPPKPVVTPWVSLPKLPTPTAAAIVQEPVKAWRGLWHAIGSNLPFYINQSRANRRALRAFGATHG